MFKIHWIILALVFGVLGTSLADEAESPALAGIPIPPGAKVNTEMNVDRDQIITQIGSILSMQGDGKTPEISETDLKAALGSLQRVQFAKMDVGGKYSAVDMLAVFENGAGGRRVVWSTDGKPGSGFMLLSMPDGGYFGTMITPSISKDGRLLAGSITAFKTVGFIDIASAIKLAVPMLKSMGLTDKVNVGTIHALK